MNALALAAKPRIAPLMHEARSDNIEAENVFNIECQSQTLTCACGCRCPSCRNGNATHPEVQKYFSTEAHQSNDMAQKIISSAPPRHIHRSGTGNAPEVVPASVLAGRKSIVAEIGNRRANR
jgi:hypothetical protein